MDAFLWRRAERVGEPADLEEAGRLVWVPLHRIPDVVHRGELLGAGVLMPLPFHLVDGDPAH